MSTVAAALTTWEEFLKLPNPEHGERYELHDGLVVIMPPPKPIHLLIQIFLTNWFTKAAKGRGRGVSEFPYRPALNFQFWYADVAYVPQQDLEAMFRDDYEVYSPPLVIEVLSPSNRAGKIKQQRLAAFSGGTNEFWVIDPRNKTVQVFEPAKPARIYTVDESIPVLALPGVSLTVAKLFDRKTLTS